MAAQTSSSCRFVTVLTRRPAVVAAGCLIAGIALHDVLPAGAGVWAALAAASAIVSLLVYHRGGLSSALLASAILFAGVSAAQLEAFYFSNNEAGTFADDEPRLARLELSLNQAPRILKASPGFMRPMPPRQVAVADVDRALLPSGWQSASGQVLLQIEPPDHRLRAGDRIRVIGILQRPAPATNPGQFDWGAYYRQQRILASLNITKPGTITIIAHSRQSILESLRSDARSLLDRGFNSAQSLDHALLGALVLGDRNPEMRDVQDEFRKTGTSHHLAISGMHVAILGAIVFFLCHALLLRPRPIICVSMSAVLLYGLVALPSPSVMRAVILCFVFGIGMLIRRRCEPIQLLAISAIAMLVTYPLDVYNAGFQLGFVTILGLMILANRLVEAARNPDVDVILATAGQSNVPRMTLFWCRLRKWLVPTLAASVVAWVVSMPLICFHFSQLNPWAVLASLVLWPTVVLALVSGFVKIALTAAMPFGAHWWAALSTMPVAWMRHMVDTLALIPGSDVPLPGKSVLFILLYYILLLAPLLPIVRPRLKRSLRLAPAGAVLLIVLIPLSGGAVLQGSGSLRMTLLSIGAGQCCAIELPNGRIIFFDAGSSTLTDPLRTCIEPFLRSCGRTHIDQLWLSHDDYDHVSAAATIIRRMGVNKLVISDEFEANAGNEADGELLDAARRQHIEISRLHRGEHVDLGAGVSIDVLWPPTKGKLNSNNAGLVLKLTYARRTILFPADIQSPPERELSHEPAALHCDVLVAPHHGSSETTTPAFIAAANPLYILSSNDRTLSRKQRIFENEIGSRPLYRTDRCGAITVTIDKTGGLKIETFVPGSATSAH